jgi:SAM-dependent methyltransferase
MIDSTKRFSNRVDNYVKYRPNYPGAVVELLTQECGLTSQSVVADIGSGTGISSELFLKNGNHVIGVEPNQAMREAADRMLNEYSRFASIDGTAEATTLEDQSVHIIVAGQAFHWFDPERTRAEFQRILVPGGWVVLMWNERRMDSTPFLRAYEQLLLTYGTDYTQVHQRNIGSAEINAFFQAHEVQSRSFENTQIFDFEGLKGRLLSSSYVPEAGQPSYDAMLRELEQMFDAHQSNGAVTIEYDTIVYYGHLHE